MCSSCLKIKNFTGYIEGAQGHKCFIIVYQDRYEIFLNIFFTFQILVIRATRVPQTNLIYYLKYTIKQVSKGCQPNSPALQGVSNLRTDCEMIQLLCCSRDS